MHTIAFEQYANRLFGTVCYNNIIRFEGDVHSPCYIKRVARKRPDASKVFQKKVSLQLKMRFAGGALSE